MNNLTVSLNAILPIFIMMLVGLVLRKLGVMTEDMIPKINNLVFRLFLPVMLFKNVYISDLRRVFDAKLIIFAVSAVLIEYFIVFAFVCLIRKDPHRRGAMIQSLFRSNYILLGIPVISSLFSDDPYALAVASVVAAFIVPLFNALAVITLEVFRGGKPKVSKILLSTVKNPLIIATALGFIAHFSGVVFPSAVMSAINSISAVASPLPIIVLGAFFRFNSFKKNITDIIICTLGRLFIIPAAGLTVSALLGFRGAEFAALLIVFSSSAAVASFTMARQMESDFRLAGEVVISTSALSCLSLFLWIFLFKQLGVL